MLETTKTDRYSDFINFRQNLPNIWNHWSTTKRGLDRRMSAIDAYRLSLDSSLAERVSALMSAMASDAVLLPNPKE